MFDNPKKDLNWLNDQLLAEGQQEETDDLDWLEAELQEARVLMDNDYSRPARRDVALYDYEAEVREEEEDEEDIALYADAPRPVKEKKPKKEKGIGGLVFLACLETLGIIAVLLWWVLWLL